MSCCDGWYHYPKNYKAEVEYPNSERFRLAWKLFGKAPF